MTKIWKQIPGWDYEITRDGRVRSMVLDKQPCPTCGHKPPGAKRGKELSSFPGPKGHLTVKLYKNGKGYDRRVHNLVLETFVGPRPPGLLGLHKDGNVEHNHVENLYWGTYSDNTADSVRHGTHPQASKDQCPRGHEYDGVRVWPDGSFRARYCKRCNNDQARKSKARNRE